MNEKIHSSTIKSRDFQNIVNKFCNIYGMYPSFIVVTPFRNYVSNWGELPLNNLPKDKLTFLEKYFLLLALGLHGIAPKTEFNRLAIRLVVSKKFDIDWKSSQVSDLSGFFATLLIMSKLLNNAYLSKEARDIVSKITNNLISIAKDKITRFTANFYLQLLGKEIFDEDMEELVKEVYEILSSPIDIKEKADEFFDIIYDLLKEESSDPNALRSKLQRFSLSLGKPTGENRSKIWGRNWRSERDAPQSGLTPEQLSELSKINPKAAYEIAKELDRNEEEGEETKTGGEKESSSGYLPGYSERLKLLQKLLSQRRFLAAIRKVRISEILSAVRERPGKKHHLAMRGFTVWEVGDDESELDIEMSLETYGYLIPNKTTLRPLYEPDKDGTKNRGIGHIEIVVDTSGSMNGPPLERAIDVAVALTEQARKNDESIALVTFSSGAWEGIPPSYDYDYMIDLLLRLVADGGTNLRGALNVIDSHLRLTSENSAIFIITDSAVWDINRAEVKEKLFEWSRRHILYMIVTADELYDETEISLRGSGVRVIRISPWREDSWEIVLSEYEKL